MPVIAIPSVNQRLNQVVRSRQPAETRSLDRESASLRDSTKLRPEFAGQSQLDDGWTTNQRDEILRIRDRLASLGAEYMRLERYHEPNVYYRFQCRIRLPGSTAYQRAFQASDENPIRAMTDVLIAARTWLSSNEASRLDE